MINRIFLADESLEEELDSPRTTPAPTVQAPKTESDKARAWFESLDLDPLQVNESFTEEFYKYEVSIGRGANCFYMFTRSPQQKQRRYSHDVAGRGDRTAMHAAMERFITKMESKAASRQAKTDAKRQARAAFVNPYKVGDILNSSWGYDQTNREFYQVLQVRDLSLQVRRVREIRDHSTQDGGYTVPSRDDFSEPARWITIQVYENGYHRIPSPIHGSLSKWNGKPLDWSDSH